MYSNSERGEECAAFKADTITVKLASGTDHSYSEFEVNHLCAAGSGAEGAGEEVTQVETANKADTKADADPGAAVPASVTGQPAEAEHGDQLDGNDGQEPADNPSASSSGDSAGQNPDKAATDDAAPDDNPEKAASTDGSAADGATDTVQPVKQQTYQAVVSLAENLDIDHISEIFVNGKKFKYIKK
ncbi:hypothetical protein [Paenibacillus sp. DMB20]|uniref:hypothetical protein n=1 Tax=Paenibacillus sp. DMB20 TaxID=1642570 RepID=UPI001F169197|nr:hypothetical protein [Paenibacillus sp. DMB20]